jgi:hypothetical protein
MLLLLNLMICGYSSIKTISVYKNVEQPFKINGIRYRESINPIFALESSSSDLFTINSSIKYEGNIINGNDQLKDKIITNTWKKIDNVIIYNEQDELYHILASTKLEKNSVISYKIMDNDNIIFEKTTPNLMHLNTYFIDYGIHNISLWAKSILPTCLCCSKDTGFKNSYQLALWKNYNSKEIEVYNKSYIDELHNVELITNTTNSNDYDDFDDLSDMNYNEILEHLETKSYILSKSLVS